MIMHLSLLNIIFLDAIFFRFWLCGMYMVSPCKCDVTIETIAYKKEYFNNLFYSSPTITAVIENYSTPSKQSDISIQHCFVTSLIKQLL